MTEQDPDAPSDAWIDDRARDRVVVRGADAASYLQSQIAQDLASVAAVGDRAWTLVLEPTGKVVALARITRVGDGEFVLDTDAGSGDALAARIERFRIRVAVEVTVERATQPAPDDAHEQERIAHGWPRMGHEIVTGETIPATTGVTDVAVSFTKGCYPGQELVERMDSRVAAPPSALRVVDVAPGSAVGDPVLGADGAEIGRLTSVAPSGDVAIARITRGHDAGRAPSRPAT